MSRVGAAALCAVLVLAGCLHDRLVDCGNGITCPADTACASIDEDSYCVSPADLAACVDHRAFDACELETGEIGACYAASPSSVCLPAGCGNGRLDPGEACDDGNGVVGDGCSANCLSDETCGNGVVDPLRFEQCDDGNLLGHDGCASNCTIETEQWEQVILGDPTPAYWQGAAYDAARGRVVVFGGAFQSAVVQVPRGDTFEWDGEGWRKATPALAPSPRWGHVLAYDPVRRRTVLFGGSSIGVEASAETWEWDGENWLMRMALASPPPRAGAVGAYDPESHRVIVFGGLDANGTALGDTWAWDGTTWTQLAGSGPAARAFGAMAYDPARGVMIVAGGLAQDGSIADTWERRAGQWTSIARTPATMIQIGMAYDGVGVVAFGGVAPFESTDTTYRWDGQAWTLLAVQGQSPSSRDRAVIVRDPRHGVLLVGGHWTTTCTGCASTLGDVMLWDGSTMKWSKPLTSAAPPARAAHGAAFDALRASLVMFGGGPSLGQVETSGTTWLLTGDHWHPLTGSGPPARAYSAMAFDAARGETVMFGGVTPQGSQLDETWLWNGTTWRLATATPHPSARTEAALAYDPVRQRTVLFGGRVVGPLADTWEWDGAAWIQRAIGSGPPARNRAVMSFDPIRGRVLLVSGEADQVNFGDTWEWDGTTWTRLTTTAAPPARGASSAAWNGARQATVLFAGAVQTFGQLDDAWELDAGSWQPQFTANRPAARHLHSVTPAQDGASVLAYGGLINNGQGTSELWRLRWSNTSPHELCTLRVDQDGDGLAGCDDPDCWSRCTPLCPPGVSCDPSWPRCGDGVCNAALEDCHLCPMDCTCTPVCGDTFCDPGETCPGDC